MKKAELFIPIPVLNILMFLYLVAGAQIGMSAELMEVLLMLRFVCYLLIPVFLIWVLKYYKEDMQLAYGLGFFVILVLLNWLLWVINKTSNSTSYDYIKIISAAFLLLEIIMIYQALQLKNEKLKMWYTLYFSVGLGMTVIQYSAPLIMAASAVQRLYNILPIASNTVLLIFALQLPRISLPEESDTPDPGDLLSKRDVE